MHTYLRLSSKSPVPNRTDKKYKNDKKQQTDQIPDNLSLSLTSRPK